MNCKEFIYTPIHVKESKMIYKINYFNENVSFAILVII